MERLPGTNAQSNGKYGSTFQATNTFLGALSILAMINQWIVDSLPTQSSKRNSITKLKNHPFLSRQWKGDKEYEKGFFALIWIHAWAQHNFSAERNVVNKVNPIALKHPSNQLLEFELYIFVCKIISWACPIEYAECTWFSIETTAPTASLLCYIAKFHKRCDLMTDKWWNERLHNALWTTERWHSEQWKNSEGTALIRNRLSTI